MLMNAASQGHADAVRLIVETGANVNARNAQGQTAIGVAEEYRERFGPQTTSQFNEVINYLGQHGGVR
jgi:ankyrin repeat protein